jgi:hypothetical protein
VEAARAFLQLGSVHADYYLNSYLCLLDCYPWLRAMLGDSGRTYSLPDTIVWLDTVSGGRLIQDGTQVPSLQYHASEFPCLFTVSARGPATTTITLVRENGMSYMVAAIRKSDTVLSVDWPTGLGITGALELLDGSSWDAAQSRVDITMHPVSMPWFDITQQAENQGWFQPLLLPPGLTEAYYRSDTLEKAAVILTALILQTPTP